MKELKEEVQQSLNGIKKLLRMFKKKDWKKITALITDIRLLVSKLKTYKKLYLSCRDFLKKQTPIGEREQKKWEDDDKWIKQIEGKYI